MIQSTLFGCIFGLLVCWGFVFPWLGKYRAIIRVGKALYWTTICAMLAATIWVGGWIAIICHGEKTDSTVTHSSTILPIDTLEDGSTVYGVTRYKDMTAYVYRNSDGQLRMTEHHGVQIKFDSREKLDGHGLYIELDVKYRGPNWMTCIPMTNKETEFWVSEGSKFQIYIVKDGQLYAADPIQ
jgi:hypothetical protein